MTNRRMQLTCGCETYKSKTGSAHCLEHSVVVHGKRTKFPVVAVRVASGATDASSWPHGADHFRRP